MNNLPVVLLTTDGSFKASVQTGGYAGVLQMGDQFLATIGNDNDIASQKSSCGPL